MEKLLIEAVLKTKQEEIRFYHNVDINRPLGTNLEFKTCLCVCFNWSNYLSVTLCLSIGLSEKAKVKCVQSLLTDQHIVGELFK